MGGRRNEQVEIYSQEQLLYLEKGIGQPQPSVSQKLSEIVLRNLILQVYLNLITFVAENFPTP